MPKIWRFPPYDEAVVKGLSSELRIPILLAQVMAARGWDVPDRAAQFLSAKLADLHEPKLLPGLTDAVERIVSAVKSNRRVTIYGDYDVDGVTSTSILWHCLQLLGAKVDYYIPHRMEEGYGLNCDAIRTLAEEDATRLVITVDCGITSCKEAALAKELGLELIITDHHQFDGTLPDALLVHPRLPGSTYPFGDLCGAGVAFKVAWGICQQLGEGGKATPRMKEFLTSAVGLAAIGTVADVVPLVGENRIIVRFGLASLVEKSSIGLKALMKVAGVDLAKALQSEDIGFAVAPRINAAGRLGQARLAVELLTTDDTARAIWLADYLNELNKNRQTVERRILKHAKEMVGENPHWEQSAALVLAHEDWHPGVIGIVASRVAEHFQKPTVMISLHRPDDLGQGSCRTFAGFDLHSGLETCREHLFSFGGHKAAAGLKVKKENIDAFRESFCLHVSENHTVTDRDLEIAIDAEVRLADLTLQAVTGIEKLGPFGAENRRPVFAATQVEVVGQPDRIGEGKRHLSLRVKHYGKTMRAIAFGQGDWADEIAAVGGPISICFAPTINRFRGQENVEMQLIDWKPCASARLPSAELASSAASDASN